MFYTYAHYTPEGRLFYIGKGQGGRAYNFCDRNKYWHNFVQKHGKPTIEILANWDTEEEAFSHETLLISCFKDMGYKLTNLTFGGEGSSGYKYTEEQRLNISKSKKGKPGWNKGIPLTEKQKQNLKEKNLGKKLSEEAKKKLSIKHKGAQHSLGYRHTEEAKKKISNALKGNKYGINNTNKRKWIWVGTCIQSGGVIKFIGTNELIKNGFQHSNIIKCINGTLKQYKSYTWHKEPWRKM